LRGGFNQLFRVEQNIVYDDERVQFFAIMAKLNAGGGIDLDGGIYGRHARY